MTAWRRVPVLGGRPNPEALGRTVRALQQIEVSAVHACGMALPDLQRVEDIVEHVRRQACAGSISDRDGHMLLRCAQRLGTELAANEHRYGGDRLLVHGDLHLGNVLATLTGCVLCDTDELGRGSRDWDLAFLVDPGRRSSLTKAERVQFESGYGGPMPSESTARTLARVAHLRRTVRLLGLPHPTIRERWWNHVRLACWDAVEADWSLDRYPAMQLSPSEQASCLVRRQLSSR